MKAPRRGVLVLLTAGRKAVFWLMSILIIVLISSVLVMWDQYFYRYCSSMLLGHALLPA